MRILLTGASGWLGRALKPRLEALGHRVIGLDPAPGPVTDLRGSVADQALVDQIFAHEEIEAVIHAGALHKPDIVRYPPQAFGAVNVQGTLNLLEAATLARVKRFIFTSTTSLMITQALHDQKDQICTWLDETWTNLAPRNIYGVTKLAAEQLCRLYAATRDLPCVVLRTGRFFPEEDDSDHSLSGPNLKANEFLHRRLSLRDAVEAHVAALERPLPSPFELFLVAAPTPFTREEAQDLSKDAPAVIARYFPQAAELYARQGWHLPARITRVYESSRLERVLGFRAAIDFAAILEALAHGRPMPFDHDPNYISPLVINPATDRSVS